MPSQLTRPIVIVPPVFWIVCGGDATVIGPAKEFIERNLGRALDVSRIAREVDLTRPHFTRVFRESEGVPPWAFVLERRVQRAAELLGQGRPVSDVAEELGFCDQSHFTRVFKQRTGQTPGAFRQRTKVQDSDEPAGQVSLEDPREPGRLPCRKPVRSKHHPPRSRIRSANGCSAHAR